MRTLHRAWNSSRSIAIAALLAAAVAAGGARASDQPDQFVIGSKLLVKSNASDATKNKLVFLSKDDSFELPSAANDPTVEGAVLHVIDLGGAAGTASINLASTRWEAVPNGFKYSGQPGDPCKRVLIKDDKLVKVVCKGASVTLAPPFSGAAALALEVGTSSIRYCATFGGAAIIKNVLKNGKGLFKGKGAPAPAACLTCGDGTLDAGEQCDDGNNANGDCCSATCQFEASGSACSDGSACTVSDQCDGSGTCTGASTCGNDIVEGACGEQCDGTDDGACENRCLDDCTCAPEPTCTGRTLFAGGPGFDACSVYDGNAVLCGQAFYVGDGGVSSCYFDDNDSCLGCDPSSQADGACVNACNPPVCVGDPSRTAFAGGPGTSACEDYGMVAGTANCNIAFHIGNGGVASCYYDPIGDECRGCGPQNQADGNCVNTCAACANDASRTIFAGGPNTSACRQYDGNQAACEQAFHRDQCRQDVSCYYDSGECRGCGPSNEADGLCRNTCSQGPVTCTNDPSRTVDAGGPQSQACHQFDGDPQACQTAFHHSECNQATSCYYDFSSDSCNGCGPTNENDGECVNTCVAGPLTCPSDATRTLFAGLPGSQACQEVGQAAGTAACEIAFHIGAGGVASCYSDGFGCQGCGPSNESDGDCVNTCIHPLTCAADPTRTIFAGGPNTAACHQFDGNQTSCEQAFHVGSGGIIASCYYSAGDCLGCGPNNEGNGECDNTCVPDTCPGDPSRTIFAGGPQTSACHFFDGNQTNCEKAFHKGSSGIISSCYYDTTDDECRGCGPSNQDSGECTNTCPVCANDLARTIFAGGPFGDGCSQFSGNVASCQNAFQFDDFGRPTSCYFDGANCNPCDSNNAGSNECSNTCVTGPPSCPRDPTRTIFAGDPNSMACHQFDGDPISCDHAFHRGNSGIASCFYEDGICSGCGSGNEGSGQCQNTCLHGVVPCTQDPTRSIFAGGPTTQACHQFDGNEVGCLSAYHLDQCRNATSCFYDSDTAECLGCGPNNADNGVCVNTCKNGPASCPLDPSRTIFGGGPQSGACGDFLSEASCLAAFHFGQCGIASCYWDGGGCQGCGPNNLYDAACFNTCQAP